METMKGKTVVLTGPTSGIGKEIAVGLGALGAKLVLGCRDVNRGRAAAIEIQHRTDAPAIDVLAVDLSNGQSIQQFARAVLERATRLDVLINNAGVSRGSEPQGKDTAGIEITFATNVMGYFLLTQALLLRLRESAPARVVNVASTFASDLDLDDLMFEKRPYEGMKAYAQSKACDRLLTWAFSRRLEGSGVTANAMAPGLIADTGLYRTRPGGRRPPAPAWRANGRARRGHRGVACEQHGPSGNQREVLREQEGNRLQFPQPRN